MNDTLSNGDIENTVQLVTENSETPEIKEVVYTFALNITKVDGSGDVITTGATFVLKDSSGNYLIVDSDNKVAGWTDDPDQASPLTTGTDGSIVVYGLDAGTYYLEETEAPDGYNALDDVLEIEISAIVNQSTGELSSYTITVNGGNAESGTDEGGNHVLSMEVENNQGATLPSTGGIGTTLLYVCGSILALVIVVLLITKIRMKAED